MTTDVAPALPQIDVDVDRMRQVFANLLSNALRHTPANGSVQVRAEQDGAKVRFVVANAANGLTPPDVTHIFERFWRADNARERDQGGSGLGLAITRQLVRLHGGRIWAESKDGWVIITFEIPAIGATAP